MLWVIGDGLVTNFTIKVSMSGTTKYAIKMIAKGIASHESLG